MQDEIYFNFSEDFDAVASNQNSQYSFEANSLINDNSWHNQSAMISSNASSDEVITDISSQVTEIGYKTGSVIPVSETYGLKQITNSNILQNDETLDDITGGNNLAFSLGGDIADKYQQSADVNKEWKSDFYSWDGEDKPTEDFYRDSNNKFASLNLGSNTREDGDKGINFDWGDGHIQNDENLLNDNFVVRSYTQANFEKGKKYKAKVRADDGYQLFAKNIITDEWLYFTPENEWKSDAYGAHKEIEFEVDERGVYDFHFHYFEGGGNAYFDLSWEEVETYNYIPELASLTEQQWDKYSGDNTKFDGNGNDDSPDSIKTIYRDISQIIFGKNVPISAGYAYDVSYRDGVTIVGADGVAKTGWSHSGIDFDSDLGDEVKAAVNGKIAKIDYEGLSLGYAIAVDETDSSGKEV
ncbi:MAG: hypothetical protein AAFY76_05290, partial [Cyanobacteria bacterium J06649_11]